MPCSDNNYDDGSEASAFKAMEILCSICSHAGQLDQLIRWNPAVKEWWRGHQKRDYESNALKASATKYPNNIPRRIKYYESLMAKCPFR